MTRLFINSGLLSKLGECNIYYISINIYILYLGLENTTLSNQNFISNKKIYTLMFWSGNSGNSGNNADQALKLQQRKIPTFIVFDSHYSHFPFCLTNLTRCFLRIFLDIHTVYSNIQLYLLIYSQINANCNINLSALLMVFILQPQVCFENINKPPGGRIKLPIAWFFIFFLKEVKND